LDGSGFFRLELLIKKEQPTNRSCPSPVSFESIDRMNLKLMIEFQGATIFRQIAEHGTVRLLG
jgi:hypothetical protein